MRKIGLYTFFLFIATIVSFTVMAEGPDKEIKEHIQRIKILLTSDEWTPVDSTTYQRINALVSYVENPTLDSLIKLVQTDTQGKKQIFTRALQDIKKPEIVKGYISQQVVQQNIENIEKDVRRLKPAHSIIVPESEFVGIYSRLPLILRGNLEQMLYVLMNPGSSGTLNLGKN
jgi:hypothetical protein